MTKAAITTHVLDLDNGYPAANIAVTLTHPSGRELSAMTNGDGRIDEWSGEVELAAGDYTLTFSVGAYFEETSRESFYGNVMVQFIVREDNDRAHYHVPLLLSPFGYSTYRGS